ncbi:hypothetical protein ACIA8G_12845 [Lentzea sp. NPDC051213]|uniref:hypothetical protein n=1 Tax=Lentzea sp. NPDC051213 TaxID=3364126 RepID=UPI00379CFD1A
MNLTRTPSAKLTLRELLATLVLAVLSASITWLFLGTHAPPTVNPVNGEWTDAAVPLITGLTLSMIALVIAATFFARPLLVTPAFALPFTAAFGVAGFYTETEDANLFLVSTIMWLFGSLLIATILSTFTDVARKHFADRRH